MTPACDPLGPSLQQVSAALRAADSVAALAATAPGIRHLAHELFASGVGARRLTQLISRLNDVLSVHLVQMVAAEERLDLQRACWLAFGSQGRSEQTLATDQDNGLLFESDDPQRDRPRWMHLGRRVSEGLDACGYPLCKGNVMASNPDCCLTGAEWCDRFSAWMERGAPEDLLQASIYFDIRGLAGRLELVQPLRELLTQKATKLPRFTKQVADNALRERASLNWRGAIATHKVDGHAMFDLKLRGTAIFVDAARLFSLSLGLPATGTRERFEAAAAALKTPPHESDAWVTAFEFLQSLRLRVQFEHDDAPDNPNLIDVDSLNDFDRKVLLEALRVGRRLQQRMELDYQR